MTDSNRLKQLNLPVINNLNDLSQELHISKKLLFKLSKFNYNYYKTFSIPKRKKGVRTIHAPKYSMRVIQSWILRRILDSISISSHAMAFRSGDNYGIVENAKLHLNREYILKIDLEDFFTSIKRDNLYPIFLGLGYSLEISNWFTNYCTVNGSLPQGASTSPALSNIVLKEFDNIVSEFSSSHDVVYTRYADDLIFSSNSRSILMNDVMPFVKKNISANGFTINAKKTRLLSKDNRQLITGILINNDYVTISRDLKRRVRAMIYKDLSTKGHLSSMTIGNLAHVKYVDSALHQKFIDYIEVLNVKYNN